MGIGGVMVVFHKSYLYIALHVVLIATHTFTLWQYVSVLQPGYCAHHSAEEYVNSRFIVFFIVFYEEPGQSHKLQHKCISTDCQAVEKKNINDWNRLKFKFSRFRWIVSEVRRF